MHTLSRKRSEIEIVLPEREACMRFFVSTVFFKLQNLTMQEEGQDLVEYALVIALISVAAVASLHTLAIAITKVFNGIATDL